MPSPLGHTLLGVATANVVAQAIGLPSSPALWAGAVILSNVPDLDWLVVASGRPMRQTHRGASHSLLVLGVGMLGLAWAGYMADGVLDARLWLAWAAALLSHPLLDVMTTSSAAATKGFGIPLLWPLSQRRWALPYPALHTNELAMYRSPSTVWRALWRETYLVGPMALALTLLARYL